jgi:hypothetical protein
MKYLSTVITTVVFCNIHRKTRALLMFKKRRIQDESILQNISYEMDTKGTKAYNASPTHGFLTILPLPTDSRNINCIHIAL